MSGASSSSVTTTTLGARSCSTATRTARWWSAMSLPTRNAVAPIAARTRPQAARSARPIRIRSRIAYSPSSSPTLASRSLVENGLVT